MGWLVGQSLHSHISSNFHPNEWRLHFLREGVVFKTIEELNKYFLDHSYCVGFAPSNRDAELFVIVHKYMDAEKYPHLARWFNHMCSFNNKA